MQWLVLRLLEDFDHSVTAIELGLRGLVELGSQLGERLEFPERSEVKPQRTGDLLHGLVLGIATHPRDADADVDRRTDAGKEQVGLEVDLAIGDRDHVGRNVGGHLALERFDDRQSGHRATTELIAELAGSFEQPAVAVEDVTRERFTARRTSHQQRQLPIGDGLFREIIVDHQSVFALVHEVLGQRRTRVGSDVLQRSGIGTRGRDDAAVVHRTVLGQHVNDGGHRARSLPAPDIDADHVSALLVENRVQRDGGLAGLAVTDDQFALAPTDRRHRVDRLDARLQRLRHRLPRCNTRRGRFQRAGLGRDNRSLAVHRVAERIDHATDHLVTDRHTQQGPRRANLVTLGDREIFAENDDSHRVLFEVEDHPPAAAGEFDHLTGHGAGESVTTGDAVADFQHAAGFGGFHRPAKVFNLLLDD